MPTLSYDFNEVNEETVEYLSKTDNSLLPTKSINIPLDIAWNTKCMNSQIFQGIMLGEGIDEISKRLQNVVTMSSKSAIRNARTMATSAQNKGRLDSYIDAKKNGVDLQKVWISTVDDRVRMDHLVLNGQVRDIEEKFSSFQYEIDYPGDPDGAPEMVYNCRCSMKTKINGFKFNKEEEFDMTYWENKKMSNVFNELKVQDKTLANDFYKELQKYGKPSEVWQKFLDGTLDPEAKAKIESYLKQLKSVSSTPVKKEKKKTDLDKAKDELDKFDVDKKYSGIWKEDVTLEDYESKSGKIQGKIDYYEQKISWLSGLDDLTSDQIDKLKEFEYMLDQLHEFENQGKLYIAAKNKYEYLLMSENVASVISKSGIFDPSLYSATEKLNANDFSSKIEADKYHRSWLDRMWSTLLDKEKYAVYEYTHNSNPINQPLSGYNDGWSRSRFVGLLNSNWSLQDTWRDVCSAFSKFGSNGHVLYRNVITDLTNAIEKSILPKSSFFVRGSDKDGLAGLIEGNMFSFDQARSLLDGSVSEMRKAFSGQVFQSHSFLSTGIASGTGFDGNVKYRVYAPGGTKCIYAEPQSHFGRTSSLGHLYRPGESYWGVGDEAEVIFQRGTSYRFTDIRKEGSTIVVEMEVVEQPDYFKYGDEDTYNNGKTRHKK